MDSLGERLRHIIDYKGFNNYEVAIMVGVHASTIKNYIENTGKQDNIKLDKICDCLSINRQWLLRGEGEMLRDEKSLKDKEVEMLREQLRMKDEMIAFYKEKVIFLENKIMDIKDTAINKTELHSNNKN
jgi:hypothetical protein